MFDTNKTTQHRQFYYSVGPIMYGITVICKFYVMPIGVINDDDDSTTQIRIILMQYGC